VLVLVLIAAVLAPAPPEAADFGRQIGASAAAAQALQGPLDGAWILAGAGDKALYQFEFVDPVGGRSPLAGAWRDLRRPPGSDDAGVINTVTRTADRLSFGFAPAGAPPVTVALHRGVGCQWTGALIANGVAKPVRLRPDSAPTADADACLRAPGARRFP